MNDFLAGAVADGLGAGVTEVEGGAEEFEGLGPGRWGFGLEERGEFGCGGVDVGCAEGDGHAAPGAEGVDGDGEGGNATVDGGSLDPERLPAPGLFHLEIGECGDFEFGGDGVLDPDEFTGLVESGNEVGV